jgi:hypothetical protein
VPSDVGGLGQCCWWGGAGGRAGIQSGRHAKLHHPGGGRTPIERRCQRTMALRYCHLAKWAPAFAGVVLLTGMVPLPGWFAKCEASTSVRRNGPQTPILGRFALAGATLRTGRSFSRH